MNDCLKAHRHTKGHLVPYNLNETNVLCYCIVHKNKAIDKQKCLQNNEQFQIINFIRNVVSKETFNS